MTPFQQNIEIPQMMCFKFNHGNHSTENKTHNRKKKKKKKVIDYSKETTLPALARCSNDQAQQTATVATSNK